MFADGQLATESSRETPEAGSSRRIGYPSPSRLPTSVDRAAAFVVVAHLLPVWWLIAGGGLYLDDLRAQAYARAQPFWSFIVSSNGTHLAPGARTLDWLQARYAPLEHWPALVVTLVVHLLLGAVLWLLLRELVGARWAALVPLSVGLMTPALLSATAWFRQTLTTLLPLVLILAAAWCAVRLVRSRHHRHLTVAAVLLLASAMLFTERALAGCSLAVALATLVPAPPTVRRPLRVVALTAPLAVVTALYLVAYRSGPFDQGTSAGLSVADLGSLVVQSLGLGVIPALLGGPWRWSESGPALSAADTPEALALVANLLVLVALVLIGRRREGRARIVRAGLFCAAYVVPIEAFLFIGRYAAFDKATGSNLRLFADCAVVICVALAVVLLGWSGRPGQSKRNTAHQAQDRRPRWAGQGLLVLLAASLAVGSGWSWLTFAERWHDTATPGYLAALRSDLARQQNSPAAAVTSIVPALIPDSVMPAWMQTEVSTLDLVALIQPSAELAVVGHTTKIVGLDGHLQAAQLKSVGTFEEGEQTFCHHQVQPNQEGPTTISAHEVVAYKRDELLEIGMLVNDERQIRVDVVDAQGTVTPVPWPRPTTLQRGPYVVRLRVPYGVDVAAVRIHPDAVGMCVVSVRALVPVEPT